MGARRPPHLYPHNSTTVENTNRYRLETDTVFRDLPSRELALIRTDLLREKTFIVFLVFRRRRTVSQLCAAVP